jgi:hypothetical protein
MPNATEAELRDATENLTGYLRALWELYRAMEKDGRICAICGQPKATFAAEEWEVPARGGMLDDIRIPRRGRRKRKARRGYSTRPSANTRWIQGFVERSNCWPVILSHEIETLCFHGQISNLRSDSK